MNCCHGILLATVLLFLAGGCDRLLALDEFNKGSDAGEGTAGTAGTAGTGGTGGGFGGMIGEYIKLQPGSFIMGSPLEEIGRLHEEVQHQVTLTRPFLMQSTEVTQGQWFAVTGKRPAYFYACGDDCPVEMVSWYDAIAFCNALSLQEGFLPCFRVGMKPYGFEDASVQVEPSWPEGLACSGYRLPTEAEWEYAARAGSTKAFHTGDIQDDACSDPAMDKAGWYCGNAEVQYDGCKDATESGGAACAGTHPARQKLSNGWGLYDMHGNVWEWVWDWHGPYVGDQTDPRGPDQGELRVGRGGHWYSGANHCRAAKRLLGAPGGRGSHVGFRVARTIGAE